MRHYDLILRSDSLLLFLSVDVGSLENWAESGLSTRVPGYIWAALISRFLGSKGRISCF